MGFHDVEFSRDISFGSRGGPMFNTSVVELASGAEERVVRWTAPRHHYDVAWGVKRLDDQAAGMQWLLDFFRARQGRAYSFRYWDPFDYSTNPLQQPNNADTVNATELDVLIGTGGGGVKVFQLSKLYTSGAIDVVRSLAKPISGTVLAALNSTLKSEGSDYTVDYSTGVVTFASAPGNGVLVTAGCHFNVPVRFEQDALLASIDEYNLGSAAGGIGLIEDVSNTQVQDVLPRLGATYQTFGADLALTPQMGEFVALDAQASGLSLILPDLTAYAPGGPHWTLKNVSAETIAVKYAGATVFTLQASGDSAKRDLALVMLGYDSSGVAAWLGVGP